MCKVSIIMAAYNSANYIGESLDSIINQDYTNWECIVCDDNSVDNTINIVNEYIKKDSRIKLIQNSNNLGAAQARNKGINIAKGDYIAILDSDDICYHNRLKEQVDFLENNEEYCFVASKAIFFNEENEWSIDAKVGCIKKDDLRIGMPLVHSTLMIKKDIMRSINGYPDYRRVQDYAMIMKVYSKGYKGYILNQNLVKYRCDNDNYRRRTFKARLIESSIRYKGYKELKFPKKYYMYVLKPIIAFILPNKIRDKYHVLKSNA